ncbi:MAG: hypothetical protein AAF546_13865 [Verrucomicrobiota bacterium]
MNLPTHITHYFEREYGPFLNICDLDEESIAELFEAERKAKTAFNRFSLGSDFMKWRRNADDLLIRAYEEKFGFSPEVRPYFAVLGSFDRTLTMFREGRKTMLEVSDFEEHELTFMYPDHSHLTTVYRVEGPHLFYQPPQNWREDPIWGRVFTYQELVSEYQDHDIENRIQRHKENSGWAGCYVEAHIWCRDGRTKLRKQGEGGESYSFRPSCPAFNAEDRSELQK